MGLCIPKHKKSDGNPDVLEPTRKEKRTEEEAAGDVKVEA